MMDRLQLELLERPLDPRRVATMRRGSQTIAFLEGHDLIRQANEVFGYGRWGFELLSPPWCAEQGEQGPNKTPYQVWAAHGRLTVEGCPPMSDIGTNVRQGTGADGLEMAIKGAATDALKRCLKNYGDQFGLVLYDKDVPPAAVLAAYEAWHRGEPHHLATPAGNPEGSIPGERAVESGGTKPAGRVTESGSTKPPGRAIESESAIPGEQAINPEGTSDGECAPATIPQWKIDFNDMRAARKVSTKYVCMVLKVGDSLPPSALWDYIHEWVNRPGNSMARLIDEAAKLAEGAR